MESATIPAPTTASGSKQSWTSTLVIGGLFLVAGRFYFKDAFPYFLDWSAEEWGRYVNFRPAFFGHIFGGTLALLLGPLQFSKTFRKRHLNVHRWMGRAYLTGILIGGLSSIQLALTTEIGIGWMYSLLALAAAWFVTGGVAFYAIKNGMTKMHQQWMVRSYIVTFGFASFRLMSQNPTITGHLGADTFETLGWASWVLPLIGAEVVFAVQEIRRRKRAMASAAAGD